MEIKTPAPMESFVDGICSICREEEDGSTEIRIPNLRFTERKVGVTRYYEARQAQLDISMVIRVPLREDITGHDCAQIRKNLQGKPVMILYRIERVEHIRSTRPPVTDLTLRQLEMHFVGGGEYCGNPTQRTCGRN